MSNAILLYIYFDCLYVFWLQLRQYVVNMYFCDIIMRFVLYIFMRALSIFPNTMNYFSAMMWLTFADRSCLALLFGVG